jgi:hypothetical protein
MLMLSKKNKKKMKKKRIVKVKKNKKFIIQEKLSLKEDTQHLSKDV